MKTVPAVAMLRKNGEPTTQRYGLERVRPREQDLGTVIAVTAIVFVFGLPLLIIFVVFFFAIKTGKPSTAWRNKLASGQQLPENFFKEAAATDIRSKGINNIFVGIGLFIFLWAITGEFGLGCIGLLVMFTGFGQLVIFYSQQKKNEK